MSTGPDFLGHYRILRTLGEGGMGIVYEAEQDQPHRRVALKVIRTDYVTPEMSRRFARESEVLGRLQHPGIAQIYEAGTAESPWGPQAYFAMELVKGVPLTEFAASRTLDLRRRLELFGKVCEAVHYAHQKGVIHRDLKPANILVEASGQPKILDFGVARVTDADVGTRQTSVGEVVGTLQYMSPEQIGADPLDLDTRSDVYSLGVILYEVLTGRLPYDLTRRLIHEAARIIMFDDPVPLSSVGRQLKGDVEVIVGKALEKDKGRRYGSADEMASDIRRYLRDEPISARPASAFYQLRKFTRRHRSIVAGVAAAMVLLVAGTAVSTWQAIRALAAERLSESRRSEASAATLLAERRRAAADSLLQIADAARALALREQEAATVSAARATSEAEKASAVNSFLQDMLASSDPSRARGADLSVREVLDQAATTVRRINVARPPEVRAAIEATIGRTYQSLGLYDKARPHLDSANALHRIAGSSPRERAVGIRDLGGLNMSAGDFPTADRQLTEALAVMRTAHAADDDRVTEVMARLAHVRYSLNRKQEAETMYRDALRLARARHGNAGATVASRLQSLGTFLTWTGRYEDGVPNLTEALVLQRKAVGDLHPDVIDNMVGLADAQRNVRDFRASESTMREALPMARQLFGDQHPALANVLQRLAAAMQSQYRLEEAEPHAREALAMRMAMLGAQHPDVQLSRTELARVLQGRQRYAAAESLYREALDARRTVLGAESPAVASSLMDLGHMEQLRGAWAAAAEHLKAAIPLWAKAGVPDEEVNAMGMYGVSLQQQGKLDEAEPILTKVLERRLVRYGEGHALVGDGYEKLALIYNARSQYVRAESLTVRALAIRRRVYGPSSVQTAQQLQNLAFMRERQNDTTGAIPHLREAAQIYAASRPAGDAGRLGVERMLAIDLCATGATVEGETMARAALASAPPDSTLPTLPLVRVALGVCLMRQQKFADAVPLFLASEAWLRPRLPGTARNYRPVATWLAESYAALGRLAEAAEWRARAQ